jgi:hypothetical protein
MTKEYCEAVEPLPNAEETAGLAFAALANETRTLDLVNRYESRYDRQYFRAHRRLLDIQDRRMRNEPDNTPPPAPSPEAPAPPPPGSGTQDTDSAKRTQPDASDVENKAPSAPIARRPFWLIDILPPEMPDSAPVFHAAASIHPS